MLPGMTSPTDRQSLIQRIDRHLSGLARARRQPNRRESYHLRDALEHLEAARHGEAEEAFMNAQRAAPLPVHAAGMIETNRPVALEELRAELARIAAG